MNGSGIKITRMAVDLQQTCVEVPCDCLPALFRLSNETGKGPVDLWRMIHEPAQVSDAPPPQRRAGPDDA